MNTRSSTGTEASKQKKAQLGGYNRSPCSPGIHGSPGNNCTEFRNTALRPPKVAPGSLYGSADLSRRNRCASWRPLDLLSSSKLDRATDRCQPRLPHERYPFTPSVTTGSE